MTFTVEVKGADELARKLGQNWKPTLQAITRAVAEKLKLVLQVPPPRNTGPVVWASEKQRAWYFAARREEGLPLEYTRNSDPWSQDLEKSWNITEQGDTDQVLAPGATYAAFVQKSDMQQPMHAATGWTTDLEAIDEVQGSGDVEEIAAQAIEAALAGA